MQVDRPHRRRGSPRARAGCVLGVTLALIACEDSPQAPRRGFTPPPARAGDGVPAEVVVTPALDTLFAVGASVSLGAVVVDADGAVVTTASVSWASDRAAVATVDGLSGQVTAAGEGTAIITAVSGTAEGRATVVVVLPATASAP